MERNERRRRKRVLFEQLRLQADILCDSHKQEAKQSAILGRMMLIILEITGERKLNRAKRETLADHFTDSDTTGSASVELGGHGDADTIYLSGAFSVSDLAKRIAWSEARGTQTVEVGHESNAA